MANISSGMGLGLSRPGRKGVQDPAGGDAAGKVADVAQKAVKANNIKKISLKIKKK